MFKCLPRRRLSILPQLSVQVLGVVVSLAPFGCLVSSPVESPGPAGEGRVLRDSSRATEQRKGHRKTSALCGKSSETLEEESDSV